MLAQDLFPVTVESERASYAVGGLTQFHIPRLWSLRRRVKRGSPTGDIYRFPDTAGGHCRTPIPPLLEWSHTCESTLVGQRYAVFRSPCRVVESIEHNTYNPTVAWYRESVCREHIIRHILSGDSGSVHPIIVIKKLNLGETRQTLKDQPQGIPTMTDNTVQTSLVCPEPVRHPSHAILVRRIKGVGNNTMPQQIGMYKPWSLCIIPLSAVLKAPSFQRHLKLPLLAASHQQGQHHDN